MATELKKSDDEPVKVTVVTPGAMVEKPSAEDKKVAEAQAEQLYGNAPYHAPAQPQTLGGPSVGAPPAQGPNLSKEEAEFAANAWVNKSADNVPEEKTPAPVQSSNEPLAEPGKEVKEKDKDKKDPTK